VIRDNARSRYAAIVWKILGIVIRSCCSSRDRAGRVVCNREDRDDDCRLAWQLFAPALRADWLLARAAGDSTA